MSKPTPSDFLSNNPLLVEHLNAAIQTIGTNTEAYYSGLLHAYRPVATELRKLLCDYQRKKDISLLPKCFPDIQLHVLASTPGMIDERTTLYIPGRMYFNGCGGSDIDQLFNEFGDMLNIEEWLNQKLFNKHITLKELIRSVADKEAAHADNNPNDTLRLSRSVFFPGDESLLAKTVIAIARYIVINVTIRSLFLTGQAKRVSEIAKEKNSRGLFTISSGDFCRYGINNIPISFIPQDQAIHLSVNSEYIEPLKELLSQYDPKAKLLLMIIDLNGYYKPIYGIGI